MKQEVHIEEAIEGEERDMENEGEERRMKEERQVKKNENVEEETIEIKLLNVRGLTKEKWVEILE